MILPPAAQAAVLRAAFPDYTFRIIAHGFEDKPVFEVKVKPDSDSQLFCVISDDAREIWATPRDQA